MRRLPLLVLLVGALVLAGCGGGEAERPDGPGGPKDAAKQSSAGPENAGGIFPSPAAPTPVYRRPSSRP
jgi:hypothetical protein